MRRNTDWDDDRIDPLRGSKQDTAFLRENYKLMEVGGVFRTVKKKFSPEKIRAGARRAGFRVQIDEEGPWLRVMVVGKLRRNLPRSSDLPQADFYTGAGKVYPE